MLPFFKTDSQQLHRYSMTVGAAIICFLYSLWLIFGAKKMGFDDEAAGRLLAVLSLSISMTLAARISTDSTKRAFGLAIGGLFIGGLFYAFNQASPHFLFRFVQLGLMTHLWVALAPAIRTRFRDQSETGRFNWFLLVRVVLVGFQSGILLIGLLTAVGSLEFLFKIDVSFGVYAATWSLVGYLITTYLLISSLGDSETTAAPRVLRLLIKNVFTPLSLLYFVILYVYGLSILITRTWPHGKVGWLVSGLSIMVTLTYLIKRPFDRKQESFSAWVETFWSWSFALLIPLLFLLCGALATRVGEYGWTDERFALAVLTAWMIGVAFFYIRPQHRTIHAIPVSLLIVLLVFWVGPVSPQKIAYRSQVKQLQALRSQANPAQSRIREIVFYICDNYGVRALGEVVGQPEKFKALFLTEDRYVCRDEAPGAPIDLAMKIIGVKTSPTEAIADENGPGSSLDISKAEGWAERLALASFGGGFVAHANLRDLARGAGNSFNDVQMEFKDPSAPMVLSWKFPGSEDSTIDLTPAIEKFRSLKDSGVPAGDARYSVSQTTKTGEMTLVFRTFRVMKIGPQFQFVALDFYAFYRPKK